MSSLRDRLCRALGCCPEPPKPGRAVRIRFTISDFPHDAGGGLITYDPQGEFMLLLNATQQARLTLDPRDAKGNPAPLDGAPRWSVADEAVATVEASEDGLSAVVRAVGVGNTQVNALGDARMGDGTKEIAGVLDVQVTAAEAVTLGIATGTVEEQE